MGILHAVRDPRRYAAVVLLAGAMVTASAISAPASNRAAATPTVFQVSVWGDDTLAGTSGPLAGASVVVYPAGQSNPSGDPSWEPNAYAATSTSDSGLAEFSVGPTTPSKVRVKVSMAGWGSHWVGSGPYNTYLTADDETFTGPVVQEELVLQVQRFQVTVYDEDSENSIPGATVSLYTADGNGLDPAYSKGADSAGQAKFAWPSLGAPSGEFRLRVSSPGYSPKWLRTVGDPNDFEHAWNIPATGSIDMGLSHDSVVSGPNPTITGTPRFGQTLHAVTGSWTPAETTFAYQWRRGGTAIADAVSESYLVTSADVGQHLSVRVVGSAPGYEQTVHDSAPTATVSAASFTSAPTPKISGTTTYGRTLKVTPGTWSPSASLSYRWYRGTSAISGATHTTYHLTTNDIGQRLHVSVTGKRTDYTTLTRTSASTATVHAASFTHAPHPSITGVRAKGHTLTVKPGTWSPWASKSYRWYRGSAKISGATKSKYKLTSKDVGHHVHVAVTGKRSGYSTLTRTSSSTGKIRS